MPQDRSHRARTIRPRPRWGSRGFCRRGRHPSQPPTPPGHCCEKYPTVPWSGSLWAASSAARSPLSGSPAPCRCARGNCTAPQDITADPCGTQAQIFRFAGPICNKPRSMLFGCETQADRLRRILVLAAGLRLTRPNSPLAACCHSSFAAYPGHPLVRKKRSIIDPIPPPRQGRRVQRGPRRRMSINDRSVYPGLAQTQPAVLHEVSFVQSPPTRCEPSGSRRSCLLGDLASAVPYGGRYRRRCC